MPGVRRDFMAAKRLLIIGWDGADWEIIDDLINRGLLKNVKEMKESGLRAKLASTLPSHSWAAWTTFLTGMEPGGHGVFDFVERDPHQPDKRIPVASSSIKSPTFFERVSAAGHEVRAANIPVTFPPIRVQGRMIAGVAIPPGAEFVYPKEWRAELDRRAPWPINGMEWARFRDNPSALVDEAHRFVERRTESFEVLLEGDWSVATCVYVAPDRLQHPFGAYLLPSHPEHEQLADTRLGYSLRDVYVLLDEHISRLRAAAGEDVIVVLMSDHGFRPVSRAANLTRVLVATGLATRSRTADTTTKALQSSFVRMVKKSRIGHAIKNRIRRPSPLDWSRTIAYQSAAGGGVSINLAGREPSGIVPHNDYEKTIEEVRRRLLSFVDPDSGEHPIAEAYSKETLYRGPYAELAPDLIVQASEMWTLSHTDAATAESKWPTGTHRREGILLATGEGIPEIDIGLRGIADVPATALSFCGIAPDGLDGRVIEEIARQSSLNTGKETPAHVMTSRQPPLSEDEQAQIASHLRDLGYIE